MTWGGGWVKHVVGGLLQALGFGWLALRVRGGAKAEAKLGQAEEDLRAIALGDERARDWDDLSDDEQRRRMRERAQRKNHS